MRTEAPLLRGVYLSDADRLDRGGGACAVADSSLQLLLGVSKTNTWVIHPILQMITEHLSWVRVAQRLIS